MPVFQKIVSSWKAMHFLAEIVSILKGLPSFTEIVSSWEIVKPLHVFEEIVNNSMALALFAKNT